MNATWRSRQRHAGGVPGRLRCSEGGGRETLGTAVCRRATAATGRTRRCLGACDAGPSADRRRCRCALPGGPGRQYRLPWPTPRCHFYTVSARSIPVRAIACVAALIALAPVSAFSQTQNSTWYFEYDAQGNRKKVIDPLNKISNYEYDAHNRLPNNGTHQWRTSPLRIMCMSSIPASAS